MSLKGNVSDLRNLRKRIANTPVHVAHDVAKRAAPALTRATRTAFSSGKTVYGSARPVGVEGQKLTLHKSGKALRSLRFDSAGTIIRSIVAVPYVRYLIGKYKVLPVGKLPLGWQRTIGQLVSDTKRQA